VFEIQTDVKNKKKIEPKNGTFRRLAKYSRRGQWGTGHVGPETKVTFKNFTLTFSGREQSQRASERASERARQTQREREREREEEEEEEEKGGARTHTETQPKALCVCLY